MNPESDDILEEYDLEPFQVDESLFDLGLSAEQQQKIYDARKEAAEQFNFLTKKNRNRFLKIKQEIQDKISGMQERISGLEVENKALIDEKQTLAKEIQRLNILMQEKDQDHLKRLEKKDEESAGVIQNLRKALEAKTVVVEPAPEPAVENEKVQPIVQEKYTENSSELEEYKNLCIELSKALFWHFENNTENIVGSGYNKTVKALNKYINLFEK